MNVGIKVEVSVDSKRSAQPKSASVQPGGKHVDSREGKNTDGVALQLRGKTLCCYFEFLATPYWCLKGDTWRKFCVGH